MRRLHHLLAIAGILLAALGAAPTWWTATLDSGQSVGVTGVSAGAVLWSVGAVVAAAYGLQLTLRGWFRRVIAGVQAGSAIAVTGITLGIAAEPLRSAETGITELTGVAGSGALLLVQSVSITGWHLTAVAAGILAAVSGLLGALSSDSSRSRDRFERHGSSGDMQDSVSAWDSLSDGTDPTQR